MLVSTEFPSKRIELASGAVHVWHADLAGAEATGQQMALLDDKERARACRLRIEEDRAQFIAAHALARILIGHYLDRAPASLRFGAGRQGKPCLIRAETDADLHFSASRTPGHTMFAFALERDVGVDVQRIIDPQTPAVYERALTAREREYLRTLTSDDEQRKAFFTFWVRKEALLKATAEGLSTSPNSLDVLDPMITRAADRERTWRIEDIAAPSGCAAAVAADGTKWRVGTLRSCTGWERPDAYCM
jgi:4'-phosphopantetheinyl transferase